MIEPSAYRYVLEAIGAQSEPLLFYLDVGTHRVGRGPVEIEIPLDGISREHCLLEVLVDGGLILRDLDSTNGTWVDGRRVTACAINQACQVAFGEHAFRVLPSQDNDLTLFSPGIVNGDESRAAADVIMPTLRPDRDAELWTAALTVLIQPQQTFPFLALLKRLRKVLGADVLQLRSRESGAIVAAVGTSEDATDELATTPHWSLWGDSDLWPSNTLLRLLTLLPSAEDGEPAVTASAAADTATIHAGLDQAMSEAHRVAQGHLSILIRGESGTGKEWTARWLHEHSPRARGPFYALNCAAIPDELLEAELFGIEAGVATGVEAREGVFARAEGGTLFLDEIGEMQPALQAKLLRALDSGEVVPVGSRRVIRTDARVLSATNRDLEQAMQQGDFRKDLFFRLAAHVLTLPPLCDRREDIPALVTAFFRQACDASHRTSPGITMRAMSALIDYAWPGNVRELRFTIERAVQLLDDGRPLDLPQLPAGVTRTGDSAQAFLLKERVAKAETQALRMALQAADGHINTACKLLGIARSTFYDKARALGLKLNQETDRK